MALPGQRGAGKSQLAAGYARACIAQDYDLVAWINAEHGPAPDLARLAVAVNLPGAASMSTSDAAAAACQWLAQDRHARRLVIYDNVDDPDTLADYLPSVGKIKVIVTSNRQEFTTMAGVTAVPVGVFTMAEGMAFLQDATGLDPADDGEAVGVQMGWLPLGLTQAAAYIAQAGLSYRAYLDALNTSDLDETLRRHAGADHSGVLKATQLSLDALNRDDPTGTSVRLLTALALLSPDGISRELLLEVEPALDLGIPVRTVLQYLATRSLLTISTDRTPGVDRGLVTVHRLIARVVRYHASLSPSGMSGALDTATRVTQAIKDSLPVPVPVAHRSKVDELTTHIGTLADHVDEPSRTLLTQTSWAAEMLMEAGNLTAAVYLDKFTHRGQLRVLGPDHPDTLTTRNNLAYWQGRSGDPAGAASAFAELLADYLRVLGPDHPDTLATRGNLAYWRGEAGDPGGAAAATAELLADRLRVLGPDHPDTLTTRGNLASWRGEAGDPGGAAAATAELLADYLRVLGSDHPDTLTTRHNLARWRGRAGDPAGAAAAFADLLADYLRVLEPDHPHALTTRNNLAYWRGRAGDPASAASAFADLLADCLRVLGPDHPHTLTTRNNLAYWRGRAGDPAAAAAAFADLLADYLRVLGPDHPHTLTTRGNLASWSGEAGDAVRAATAFAELLNDRLRVLGPDHPDTLGTRGNLARWRGEAGDLLGTVTATTELLDDYLRVLGPDHPDTLVTRGNLARWRGQAGDPVGAVTATTELLDDYLRVLGPDHPDTLTARKNLTYWQKKAYPTDTLL